MVLASSDTTPPQLLCNGDCKLRPRMREEELAGTRGGVSEIDVDGGVDVDAGAGTCAAAAAAAIDVDTDGNGDEGDIADEEGLEETVDDALEASEKLRSDRSPVPGCVALGFTVLLATKVCLLSSRR